MCYTKIELNEAIATIRSLKALKEETENEIKALENEVIAFLKETEECKTTDKNGKDILQYIGSDYKATYSLRERETLDKDKIKQMLKQEDFEKVIKKSSYNVLMIK